MQDFVGFVNCGIESSVALRISAFVGIIILAVAGVMGFVLMSQ